MTQRDEGGKHTVYYNLLDACKRGGCPVCALTLETVARYLESVIYEHVNDPETRERIVSVRGYCSTHAWQLREKGTAALGAAMIYRDIVRHVAAAIEREPGGKLDIFGQGQGGGLLGRLAAFGGGEGGRRGQGAGDRRLTCPACHERERYEGIYLRALLEHAGDELLAAYESAGGLCLIHLDQLVALARDGAGLRRLLEVQRRCMLALYDELSEFIRKNDYRFQREKMGPEGTSWIRAIELVAGKPGIR